jgi:hypothetical protein
MKTNEFCTICTKEIERDENSCSTGYGINNKGEKICFACCGEQDKKTLLESGKLSGYYSGGYFTNWPGTLKVKIYYSRDSWHNFAGRNGRTDFWFTLEGKRFHGVHIGHNNECANVRKVKS